MSGVTGFARATSEREGRRTKGVLVPSAWPGPLARNRVIQAPLLPPPLQSRLPLKAFIATCRAFIYIGVIFTIKSHHPCRTPGIRQTAMS